MRRFSTGETIRFGRVSVETIPTPHDGVDGVVFVVDDGVHRLGILTDLGHVFAELEAIVASLDAVLLESNYDPDMLEDGPYPYFLKEHIKGPTGHISNIEAAQVLGSRARRTCSGPAWPIYRKTIIRPNWPSRRTDGFSASGCPYRLLPATRQAM